YAYGVVAAEGSVLSTYHSELMQKLSEWGLPIAGESHTVLGLQGMIDYCTYLGHKRDNLPYEIDGIVFKVNDINLQQQL
ncbi:NAD-dependent DNA ligase LigA, partial [Acinetobacter baumannii]